MLKTEEIRALLAPGEKPDIAVIGSVVRELNEKVDMLGQAMTKLMLMLKGATPGVSTAAAATTSEAVEGISGGGEDDEAVVQQLRDKANASLKDADKIMDAAINALEAEKAAKGQSAQFPPPAPAKAANGKAAGA